MFEVIPAIDLIGGRCVRLTEGRYDSEKVFSDDPVSIALSFEAQGAKRLHIVDLEAAKSGEPTNWSMVEKIIRSVRIPVELGGGIRTLELIQKALDIGVTWPILGTVACKNPYLVEMAATQWNGHIIVGIDARNGMAATDGWTQQSLVPAEELAARFEKLKIGGIIYTDIARDGRLGGPNIRSISDFTGRVNLPIIASGGISQIEDLLALQSLECPRLIGAIVGKAIYEGRFQLNEAIKRLALKEPVN